MTDASTDSSAPSIHIQRVVDEIDDEAHLPVTTTSSSVTERSMSTDENTNPTPTVEDVNSTNLTPHGITLNPGISLVADDMKEMELSSSNASTATVTHPTKRKKEELDTQGELDAHELESRKHARSSTQQSAATSPHKRPTPSPPTHSLNDEEDEEEDLGLDTELRDAPSEEEEKSSTLMSQLKEISTSALLDTALDTSLDPTPPRRLVPKRKLDDAEGVVHLEPANIQPKKTKIDPSVAASFRYFHGELDYADRISTGFIDPGRKSKLFASIEDDISTLTLDDVYQMPMNETEREIILVDEERDVRLKQIYKQARLMLKQATANPSRPFTPEELQLQVKVLACLVSDSFGGRIVVVNAPQINDAKRNNNMGVNENGAISPSPTATTATASSSSSSSSSPAFQLPPSLLAPLQNLYALCHNEVNWMRNTSQSNVVLLCSIQHGLCRHRSILMKYLIDKLFHPTDVACKLVRGYREGGISHSWTVVRIREGAEFILDTLDSPHLFRPLSSMIDPTFAYYPLFALSSSTAFATDRPELASLRDLHMARRGRLLGEGSYSQVFECILPADAATSHTCALKVSPIDHLTTAQFAALLKEIRILPHLQHKNIVQFLGYIITNTELKLFMELIRGQNLEVIIKAMRREGKRFSVEDILIILLEVARGLQYLHHHATLHRDLKAPQILIGHPELQMNQGVATTSFTMPIATNNPNQHSERTIVKVKRKFKYEPATAASSTVVPLHPLSLAPRSKDAISFFSDAQIKVCDFNIAIPILETHEETDHHDPDAFVPKLEYVGTLRWCSPEVFRASLPGHDEEVTTQNGAASSTTSPAAAPTPASIRLQAGKMSDIWSLANVLFELLTLHLPYENVPTEPELNEKLTRGERTDYLPWLDPQYWSHSNENGQEEKSSLESTDPSQQIWHQAVQFATSTSDAAASSFITPTNLYASLVGLFLEGTNSIPHQRPDIDTIVNTLSWLLEKRMQQARATGSATVTMMSEESQKSDQACTDEFSTTSKDETKDPSQPALIPLPLSVN